MFSERQLLQKLQHFNITHTDPQSNQLRQAWGGNKFISDSQPLLMKTLRLLRWSGAVLSPRTRSCYLPKQFNFSIRFQSAVAASIQPQISHDNNPSPSLPSPELDLRTLPSPPPSLASSSAKLFALRARLCLHRRFPLETLARCLIDPSADPNPAFNNESLTILGADFFAYYTAEYILCRYPRLPSEVVFAALSAYCGSKTLAFISKEWGVELAGEPGGEVDPGYLQCKRRPAGNAEAESSPGMWVKETETKNTKEQSGRRGASHRALYDDEFGTLASPRDAAYYAERPELSEAERLAEEAKGVTLEEASARFVRAVMGAIYLHLGRRSTKDFFRNHILSRHLDVGKMFEFRQPTRDLSKLCAREGFENPVARILSETGRNTRHPVFVVGVFAGNEKLGEGAGASLDEARIRAAVGALKGWYLYSPLEVRVPSDVEADKGNQPIPPWKPVLVDGGEVIV